MNDRRKLNQEFLQAFPLEQLPEMTLEQYTDLKRDNSFCYWVESKTKNLGSIGGGSSYKFGIYEYNNTPTEDSNTFIHDEKYTWYKKYKKSSSAEAFELVRNAIVKIANFANSGQFEEIDKIQGVFGDIYKWKIAFLYSNEKLLPFYQVNMLRILAKHFTMPNADNATRLDIHRYLLSLNEDKDFWDYYDGLLSVVKAEEEDIVNGRAIPSGDIRYWWLVANPKIWSMADMAVGTKVEYSLYNDNNKPRRIAQNFLDAKVGDKVIGYESTPTKQIVAMLEVSRANDGKTIEFTKTKSLERPVDYSLFKDLKELASMQFLQNPQGSFFALTQAEYEAIIDILDDDNPIRTTSKKKPEKYHKEDFLSEVYMKEKDYNSLLHLLKTKKNIILQGAPGVGKTFSAKRLAYSMMGMKDEERVEVVQFHQNYTYEDFIMGYKPIENGGFKLMNGIFYRFCKKAESDLEREYFFIIDEINRGNLSKVFGELMMLIENGYRGKSIKLAYTNELFSVPENIYLIGMMNTADRSLAMIDYALRRRFSFFDMKPGFDSEGFKDYQKDLNNETFDRFIQAIESLNDTIAKDDSLGTGFCIGHSYFCEQKSFDKQWLENVLNYDIAPMLREYWFDDATKANTQIEELRKILK
jgi:5-methylcytosine-specific restriction protein B